MVVEAKRLPFESLTRVAERLAGGVPLAEALELLAAAAEEVTDADLAVVRVLDDGEEMLIARAVAPAGSVLAAEIAGSRVASDYEVGSRRLLVPARVGGSVVGAIELIRLEGEFDQSAFALAELIAAQLAIALTLLPGSRAGVDAEARLAGLVRSGEALAAGAELERAARQAVREAKEATSALQAAIWQSAGDGLELVASDGIWDDDVLERARTQALEVRSVWRPLLVDPDPVDSSSLVSIRLGEPTFGVLQLRYGYDPTTAELDALTSFAVRVAHALRAGERARDARARARANACPSLGRRRGDRATLARAHARDGRRAHRRAARDRRCRHLPAGRATPAGRGGTRAAPRHEEVAEALTGARARACGRARRSRCARAAARSGARVRRARALEAAGVEGRACGAAARPRRDDRAARRLSRRAPAQPTASAALLAALAAQLAVAVQNARLHEQAKELGEALGSALASERQAARRLRALYEISNTFTSSLSLETTLQAVTGRSSRCSASMRP